MLVHYGDGTEAGFEYDAEQNLIVMTDELGASGWVYDGAGQVTQATDSLGEVIGYGYDQVSGVD